MHAYVFEERDAFVGPVDNRSSKDPRKASRFSFRKALMKNKGVFQVELLTLIL